MKNSVFLLLAIAAFALYSCHGGEDKAKAKQFPKPGTIVASAEMPVAEETLNHFVFAIKVVADSNIAKGVYDVDVDYGPNFAEGQFTMPTGGEDLKPVVKKGTAPYTYIIGFKLPNDTTFYDYFEVHSEKAVTKMQYIKAYSF